jgi:hypothetical protein
MPERALIRLRKAEISVFNVKKTQKNQIVLLVNAKDSEKVFAIFPNVCYNIGEYTPYTVRKMETVGVAKYVEKCYRRIGLVLGALLFCVSTLYVDRLVLGIKVVGDATYTREAHAALQTHGIKPWSVYDASKIDGVTAELLRVPTMEFCSVQKRGVFVYVEMRLSPFARNARKHGDMRAERDGTILSLTVLSGTKLKNVGEQVNIGEPLVGAYVTAEGGKQSKTDVVARAYIACTYEQTLNVETEEEAFAQAYLQIALTERDVLNEINITPTQAGFCVKANYTTVQTLNL